MSRRIVLESRLEELRGGERQAQAGPRWLKQVFNNSGITLTKGAVVVWDTPTVDLFKVTTTTSLNDSRVAGVWYSDSTVNGAIGMMQTKGPMVTSLKVNGTVAIVAGDLLGTFSTAGIAQKNTSSAGSFARAITGYSTADSAGTISALVDVDGLRMTSSTGVSNPIQLAGNAATITLTADQSGSIAPFNRSTGIVYTLPAPVVGMRFTFPYVVSLASGAYTVITDAGTTFVLGSIVIQDASNVATGWAGNGSSHVKVTSNGTTTGGIKGGEITFRCVSSTLWLASGQLVGSGTIATPFST